MGWPKPGNSIGIAKYGLTQTQTARKAKMSHNYLCFSPSLSGRGAYMTVGGAFGCKLSFHWDKLLDTSQGMAGQWLWSSEARELKRPKRRQGLVGGGGPWRRGRWLQ